MSRGPLKSKKFQPGLLARVFADMPIKRKLMVIIMAVTTAALVMAGLGVVVADSILFRGYLRRDLSALARITADNSTAALTFDDPRAAGETLAALRARTHVLAACIYRVDGTMLARYARQPENAECPPPAGQDGVRLSGGEITVSRAVRLDGRRVGTLVMRYDLDELYERLWLYGGTVLAILLASSIVAFLLSSWLRRVIATPISQLALTTAAVSETRDYGIRAHKTSRDELGVLVDTFNQMLARIESRDQELRQALEAREEALKEAQNAIRALKTAQAEVARINVDLQKSNQRLARSNQDLERFAFVASHDLQEPLRMITAYVQLLVRSNPEAFEGEARMFVRNIVDGAVRMRTLLADLLAYSEIGGDAEEPAGRVDLNQVVETVRQNLKMPIEETGAVITSEELPAVAGYSGHFVQLFQNLAGNAIKYRGEDPPRIHISARRQGNRWQFAVADNGIGIDPEYHAKIFGVFKRLHGKKIPGTGIGLAICQRLVERYRGRIWVESEPGRGATFYFTLPEDGLARKGTDEPGDGRTQGSHPAD